MARVLVVDDERGIRNTLKEFLKSSGHTVYLAANVNEGREVLDARAIDVIVLDVVLPRESGLDLLEHVHVARPEVETIMMTGEPTIETTVRAMRLGAFDFLAKPVRGASMCQVVDQAAQKKAQRDATQRALVESEARFQRITENAQDMIWRADPGCRLEYINLAVTRLLDRTPTELLGAPVEEYMERDSAHRLLAWAEALQAADGSDTPQLPSAVDYLHKSGRVVPCELNVTVVRDDRGEIVALEGISRDITKRLRDAETKERLEDHLRYSQRMEAVGQLAGGVAHDMNNFLGAIMAAASVLQSEVDPESRGARDVHSILEACRRGGRLTRNLLRFAHRGKGENEWFLVSEAVEATKDLLERTIPKNISVAADLNEQLWGVEGDRGQIGQALLNVCLNAVDAMPYGGTLTLTARNLILDEASRLDWGNVEAGEYVLLQVIDTGEGMSRETLEHIFEPFYTTKPASEGSGLGLSLVYGTMQGHGGMVKMTSEIGAGATASLILPAADPTATPRPDAATVTAEPDAAVETAMVLLVDDEELIRYAGQRMLEKLGHKVLLAENGVEALEVYRRAGSDIALVILDLIMPRMDGQETFARLKEVDPEVRILVASGLSSEDKVSGLLEQGAQGYVEKPFEYGEFSEKVAAALR